ncbi:hypothetical protein AAFN47_18725 [Hoeflea sp. CAU 1731]
MRKITRKESGDDYTPVIHQHGKYRVIVCRDHLQWILQRRKGGPGSEWRGISYCRTSASLISKWSRLTGEIDPPALDCLPSRIEGGLAR